MADPKKHLDELKSADPQRRAFATQALWNEWYREAGDLAEMELHKGLTMMDNNRLDDAEMHFTKLSEVFPDFAEARNKLATVLYLLGRYEESVIACQQVLDANPHHFGAWNGLGMCLYQLGRYDTALISFQKALDIQPYAEANSVYIARCRGHLN
ncbi:MAG: tetratricopeptide repeat protein [Candidatus Nitrohelix vancouverensis]|uniref:Tetratricopeptide repeat protein n=1 Tax=Candidatus Nitrohelix vancouverensis TaxID=2705534 RepID=A0A7T0C2T9_9BACT|nr:MAG: tetratricopeptide repeat protein [Candidatus Nitrohelix vancouverensis]